MYEFIAAAMNYWEIGALRQQKIIILQFWMSDPK